ncbi:hypothetical protein GQ607_012950 [Colletotrichum asianum]|uniref:Uncharacterized protein n=1 Tax=Colletotrichum asianum TaxID=702518 RepID=A0A8H3W7Z7_9PEZI|nr:hypothetical protein GQ607_012950 [Colletotrichum asianum]
MKTAPSTAAASSLTIGQFSSRAVETLRTPQRRLQNSTPANVGGCSSSFTLSETCQPTGAIPDSTTPDTARLAERLQCHPTGFMPSPLDWQTIVIEHSCLSRTNVCFPCPFKIMPCPPVDSRTESRRLPIELLSPASEGCALLSMALVGRVMSRRSTWDSLDNVSDRRRHSGLDSSRGKHPRSRLELEASHTTRE